MLHIFKPIFTRRFLILRKIPEPSTLFSCDQASSAHDNYGQREFHHGVAPLSPDGNRYQRGSQK